MLTLCTLAQRDLENLPSVTDRVDLDIRKYSRHNHGNTPIPSRYIRYGDIESLAYLRAHGYEAYCCSKTALEEVTQRLKTFYPTSILEAGFGPGLGLL